MKPTDKQKEPADNMELSKELLLKLFGKNENGLSYGMRMEKNLLPRIEELGLPADILEQFEAAGMVKRDHFAVTYWTIK